VYKLLFGMVDADVPSLFVVNNVDTVTFVQQSRSDPRKYFFSNRVIQSWNSLPVTPENFSSLACFRRFLQHNDLSKFTIGSN